MAERMWVVRLIDGRFRRDVRVLAVSEDEAIGKALRKAGLHSGWEVIGWWPER